MTNIGVGNDSTVGMYRITRIRYENTITGAQNRHREVRNALFGTQTHDGFTLRVQVDIKPSLVPVADRLA